MKIISLLLIASFYSFVAYSKESPEEIAFKAMKAYLVDDPDMSEPTNDYSHAFHSMTSDLIRKLIESESSLTTGWFGV